MFTIFMDKFKYFFILKRFKLFLGITLLVLGILILGAKYCLGGFSAIDYVLFKNNQLTNIKSFFSYWSFNWRVYCPGDSYFQGFGAVGVSGYAASYRPITALIIGLEYFLFKLNYFLYFLINILVHSINSVLFLCILNWFFPLWVAFLGALFFLFQGTLFVVFLHAYNINYLFTTTCLLLIVIFLKKYLYSNSCRFYLFAALFFFLGQFTRDIFVVLPFILFVGVYLFYLNRLKFDLNLFWIALKRTYLFFLVSLTYVGILFYRILLFKSNTSEILGINILMLKWKDIIWTFMAYFKDAFGLFFLRDDVNTKISLVAILIFLFFLSYLFFKINFLEKFYVLFLVLSAATLTWPIFTFGYGVCYLYTGVPILLFVVWFLLHKNNFLGQEKLFNLIVFCLAIWGAFFNDKIWGDRASWIKSVNILDNFVRENQLHSGSCCKFVFVVTPKVLDSLSLLQHLQLITGSDKVQVYTIGSTIYSDSLKNLGKQIIIKKIKNGFQLVSLDKDIYFRLHAGLVYSLAKNENYVGQFGVNEWFEEDRKIKDLNFVFNEKWLKQNSDVQFFTWDFKNNRFYRLFLGD